MANRHQPLPPERPECMSVLGLLPPYTAEDVKQAYFEKVKTAHPDVGGNVADFLRLQEAYQQANEYVDFRKSRMEWLAAHMDQYLKQSLVTDELTRLGGRVKIQEIDWHRKAFGEDFAQIMATIVSIHLCGPEIGDEVIELLVKEHGLLHRLRILDFRWSRIGDGDLRCLRIFSGLHDLDLRGTQITLRASRIVRWFPHLHRLGIDRSNAPLLDRLRLRFSDRHVEIVTAESHE